MSDDCARIGLRADPIAGSEVVEDKQAGDEKIEGRIGRIDRRCGWRRGEQDQKRGNGGHALW